MVNIDALTAARESLETVEECVPKMRDALSSLRTARDPLGRIYYWKALALLVGQYCTEIGKSLDVLISEMETIESLKGKEDDKR